MGLNYRNSKLAEYLTRKLHVALFFRSFDQPSNTWLIDIVLSQFVIIDKGFFQAHLKLHTPIRTVSYVLDFFDQACKRC